MSTEDRALESAITAERLAGMRRISAVRVVAAGLWLLLTAIFGLGLRDEYWSAQVIPVGLYAVAAVALFAGARVDDRAVRLAWLGPVVVDQIMVWFTQSRGIEIAAWRTAPAYTAVALFMIADVLALLTWSRATLVAACLVSTVLSEALLYQGGSDLGARFGIVVMFAIFAAAALHAEERIRHLAFTLSREREHLSRLGRYFSPTVVDRILERGIEERGEARDVTIVFSDIRGFTAMSESMDPADIVAFLNDFHATMVAIVFKHGGTLDKFLGDGTLVYFGAPLEQPDHARRAVRCAMEMVTALEELNAERARRGQAQIAIGVGIHTGRVVVGDIGTAARKEYTIVGDAVNLASRVESLTKVHGVEVLVTETTRVGVGDMVGFRELDPVIVKGKADPVRTFTPDREVAGSR